MPPIAITDRIRYLFTGRLPKETKQAVGGMVTGLPGAPTYPAPRFETFAREAYGRNEVIYAGIQEIATSASEAPLRVYRRQESGPEEIPDHPLRALIRRPNPHLTEYELWELTDIHLYLAGNAFWEVVPSRSGRPVEIWPLRPDRVRIYSSSSSLIDHYTFEVDGVEYPLDPRYVVHFRFPDPLNPVMGMPPILAALRAVATDNEATNYTKSLLENRAIPGVVIEVERALDEPTTNRLTALWKQAFGGRRRGAPAFLQKGMAVHELGQSLKDLEFPDLRTINETRILMALGVPPILVGAKAGIEHSSYANYEHARRSFWEETVLPLQRRLSDRVNLHLLPLFGTDASLEARFDTSSVSALRESEDARWTRANNAVTSGWIMVNEARSVVGLPPDPAGNVYLRPSTVAVVPVGEEPQAQESAPEPEGRSLPGPETKLRIVSQFKALDEADRYSGRLQDWARQEFAAEGKDVLRALATYEADHKALGDPTWWEGFLGTLPTQVLGWSARIRLGVHPILDTLLLESATGSAASLGITFDLPTDEAERFLDSYVMRFASNLSEVSQRAITETIRRGIQEGKSYRDLRADLQSLFTAWSDSRADMVARTESIRAANAGTMLGYQRSGVERVRWLATDDACEICLALDGQEWTVGEQLAEQGDTLQAGDTTLRLDYEPLEYPPAHPGCRCTIIPVV